MKIKLTQEQESLNLIKRTKPQGACPLAFRYPGGKYYALNILSPFWESVEHDEYREPFVGGGSIFFSKPSTAYDWINDLDEELICTLQVMAEPKQRARLIELLNAEEEASKERWKEVFLSKAKTNLQKAFKYYYLNRTSFSGKLVSPAWGYRPKRSLPPSRWVERVIPCGEKLEEANITNMDFAQVIEAPKTGRNVLMFVDPPYFLPPKNKHYRHGFDYQDHVRLMESLRDSPHKFFLTYDDAPGVRELYKWANIYEVSFFYRVDNSNVKKGLRQQGFELVITNYKLDKEKFPQGELFEK